MNVDHLLILREVMIQGSFARVARRRSCDPSLVSRAVAGLEEELGFRLFERSTRRLAPTEAGRRYAERISPLLDELQQAHDDAAETTQSVRGELRLTASVAYGHRRLVPLLGAFRTRFPDLSLELVLSDARLDLIAEGLDLALRLGPPGEPDLIGSRLHGTRYRVCASPAYLAARPAPARPADLEDHDCLRFPFAGFHQAWQFLAPDGTSYNVPVNGSITISNALALREAALDGLGPALLADWLTADDLQAGRLVDLFPHYRVHAGEADSAAWLLFPSRRHLPAKVRVTIDFLKDHLGDGLPR